MGVADVVRTVAKAVARVTNPTDPLDRIRLRILQLMPDYRDAHKLVAWEYAFKGVASDTNESDVGRMLQEVFDFGMLNAYAQFDGPRTVAAFRQLSDWLAERGVVVAVPEPRELTKW
ncbi:unnamed protein product [Gemmataceae bacterium]|nr:unnamed protein product [Gemmataceae bacterium]VTU02212.1 unnamed protein product [Gemmataceae bacterium]